MRKNAEIPMVADNSRRSSIGTGARGDRPSNFRRHLLAGLLGMGAAVPVSAAIIHQLGDRQSTSPAAERSFDIKECVVGTPDDLPMQDFSGLYPKAARLLHTTIHTAMKAEYFAAACPQDINPLIQTQGEVIHDFVYHSTHQTGVLYGHCELFGTTVQLDGKLPADRAPMLLACEDPKYFAEA